MKAHNKRARQLMRVRNRNRVNWLHNQQVIQLPIILSPVFVMVMIKIGLRGITNPTKMVFRLSLLIKKLNGNPNFPVTSPTTGTLQMLEDALSQTITEITGGDLSRIPHREALLLEAENAIRLLSYDIQKQSGGDSEKIQSAGFEVRKGRSASQEAGGVFNLRAKPLATTKIKLLWNKIAFSRMNYVEVTDNPTIGTWVPIGKTTRSSFVATGLIPGNLYFFRVYGSNNLGDGASGSPVEQRSL